MLLHVDWTQFIFHHFLCAANAAQHLIGSCPKSFSTFLYLAESAQPHHPHPSVLKDAIHIHRVSKITRRIAFYRHNDSTGSVASGCLGASRLLANCKIAVQLHDKLPLRRLQPRSRIAIPLQTQPGQSTAQLIS